MGFWSMIWLLPVYVLIRLTAPKVKMGHEYDAWDFHGPLTCHRGLPWFTSGFL
jgi:hypothetical protein